MPLGGYWHQDWPYNYFVFPLLTHGISFLPLICSWHKAYNNLKKHAPSLGQTVRKLCAFSGKHFPREVPRLQTLPRDSLSTQVTSYGRLLKDKPCGFSTVCPKLGAAFCRIVVALNTILKYRLLKYKEAGRNIQPSKVATP